MDPTKRAPFPGISIVPVKIAVKMQQTIHR
jgi:hypothetical protein